MTPERWQQIKQLVNSALAEDADTRSAVLQRSCSEACPDDLPLRLGAEALLSFHEDATRRLVQAPAVAAGMNSQAPLSPDRWQQIEHIFQAAMELPFAQRAAYLTKACGDDEALRQEVEALLVFQTGMSGVLQGAIRQAAGLLANEAGEKACFTPGMTLNKRYRIIGLLGRGGMGEVYRADDLKLGQPVALKFLTEKLSQDKAMLARFYSEVAMAHRVTHPNVCRVHDIGDVTTSSGHLHFLSMEYVDGEDLSCLLRRIGRLPADKAVEIANQLCAGLAAAHEVGVLHRDLKPANVMLDGKGRVRITDFGLAGFAEQIKGNEVMAGTPAYMSPEQFAGKEVTTKSDIYALGLVLYEIFTGMRVFEAGSLAELQQMHESSSPTNPSNWVKDIDPLVERVILRCLEKDPSKRLASAKQVADALPGGDPLAAALALGETPSPEMVAAAGTTTGLRPAVAVTCLVAVIIGLFLAVWVKSKVSLIQRTPLDPPDALERKAREISTRLGYPDPPADTWGNFQYNSAYLLQYVLKNDPSPMRWNRMQFPAITFYYFESAQAIPVVINIWGHALPAFPPFSRSIHVRLDPQGRLLYFRATPPRVSEKAISAIDWAVLFREAGLDPARFTLTEPRWTPPFAFDERAAWTGVAPQSDVPLRIEAAAWQGKPVFFEIIYPWTETEFAPNSMFLGPPLVGTVFVLIILISAGLVAWANYRQGRGDYRGAFKLSCLIFVLAWLHQFLKIHHAPTLNSLLNTMQIELPVALFYAALVWLTYFAFEPFLRRYWPSSIITWSRVLAGRIRDVLVGRDVLIGMLFGIGSFLMYRTIDYLIGYQGVFVAVGTSLDLWTLNHNLYGELIGHVQQAIQVSAVSFFMLFLLRVLLRRQWLAVSAAILLFVLLSFPAFSYRPFIAVPAVTLLIACSVIFATRFGLVATIASVFAGGVLASFPLTPNVSAWYFGIGLIGPLTVLALAIYGFHTSLGGQKVFAGKLLDE